MIGLALKNCIRRPIRTILTLCGLAVSVALLSCLLACGTGYQSSLGRELNGMGVQLMVVPLGCPYDAAARVLKGRSLNVSFPENALQAVRHDSDVAVAAPMFSAERPRPSEGRTDLWVGIDASTLALKPWLKLTDGSRWFQDSHSVVLGADAAETELRHTGDQFLDPETNTVLHVSGVLEHNGTSDDSLFFLPLATAQRMFHGAGKLTAIAVRLKDPTKLEAVANTLQQIPGAQVVTMTEMMGTFLNLAGSARSLVLALGLIAISVSTLGVFNAMTANMLERTPELGVMRAIGFSQIAVFKLMVFEAIALSFAGGALGLALSAVLSRSIGAVIRPYLPLAPSNGLFAWTFENVGFCLGLSVFVGVIAGIIPAWQASRLRPAAALRESA